MPRKRKVERYVIKSGYAFIYIEGRGFVSEHRYVVEQKLGRKLKKYEHVHHIDKDKLNNSLDNLMVLTNSEHAKLHVKDLHAIRKPRGRAKNQPKTQPINPKNIIVPKEKLPRGYYFLKGVGIVEKRKKTEKKGDLVGKMRYNRSIKNA